MEPRKRARYSKSMELPEIVEILMEDESDEELEELNELIEGNQNASSSARSSPPPSPSSPPRSPSPSSSHEEEIEIEFHNRRGTDTANIHDFTGLPNGIKKSAAPNISVESSPFTIFFSFLPAYFFNITKRNKQIFSTICCLPRRSW